MKKRLEQARLLCGVALLLGVGACTDDVAHPTDEVSAVDTIKGAAHTFQVGGNCHGETFDQDCQDDIDLFEQKYLHCFDQGDYGYYCNEEIGRCVGYASLLDIACMNGDGGTTTPPPSSCDDNNPCTDDLVVGGSCQHTPNYNSCDDGNACTSGDWCGEDGLCYPGTGICDDDPPDDPPDTCVPACGNKQCGNDGCGGSCGTCSSGKTCQSGYCEQVSSPPAPPPSSSAKRLVRLTRGFPESWDLTHFAIEGFYCGGPNVEFLDTWPGVDNCTQWSKWNEFLDVNGSPSSWSFPSSSVLQVVVEIPSDVFLFTNNEHQFQVGKPPVSWCSHTTGPPSGQGWFMAEAFVNNSWQELEVTYVDNFEGGCNACYEIP